jgi:cob(I)alamin adenosyltransferase
LTRVSAGVKNLKGVKIYTKGGDTGETGLIDGSRVPKDDGRVAAYGDVDELSAAIGLARAHAGDDAVRSLLHQIQKDLFALGAQLADPQALIGSRKSKAAVAASHVEALERAIDVRQAALPPLQAFILPGGAADAAFLHLARTVCRRGERAVVSLARREKVDPLVVAYLNRLSDLLFVLAREANHRAGEAEERW